MQSRGLLHKIVRFETYLPVDTFWGGWYVSQKGKHTYSHWNMPTGRYGSKRTILCNRALCSYIRPLLYVRGWYLVGHFSVWTFHLCISLPFHMQRDGLRDSIFWLKIVLFIKSYYLSHWCVGINYELTSSFLSLEVGCHCCPKHRHSRINSRECAFDHN